MSELTVQEFMKVEGTDWSEHCRIFWSEYFKNDITQEQWELEQYRENNN